MLRFLRKYQKLMLAVFASGLMVVFLFPSAGQMFYTKPSDRVIATLRDGSKMLQKDVVQANQHLSVLERMLQANRMAVLMVDPLLLGLHEDDSPQRWALIQHEAAKLNIKPGLEEAQQLLGALLPPETTDEQFAAQCGANVPMLEDALRSLLAAEALRNLHQGWAGIPSQELPLTDGGTANAGAPAVARLTSRMQSMFAMQALMYGRVDLAGTGYLRGSIPQTRRIMQRMHSTLDARMVLLGTDDAPEQPAADEAELQALFEAHKDVFAGEGEHGFGWRLPDRMALDWVIVDSQAAKAAADQQLADNPDLLIDHLSAAGVLEADAAAQKRAEDELRARLANEAREAALREGQRLIAAAERTGQPTPNADAVAQAITEAGGLPAEAASHTDLLDAQALSADPLLGQARDAAGNPAPTFLMDNLDIFLTEDPEGALLTAGAWTQPFLTPEGQGLLLRVREADPEHVPASLDDVRDTVTEAAQRLARYRFITQTRLDALRQSVQEGGLAALSTSGDRQLHPLPNLTLAGSDQINRRFGVRHADDFCRDAFDLARRSADLGALSEADRLLIAPDPDTLQVALIVVDRMQELTAERLAQVLAEPEALMPALNPLMSSPERARLLVAAIDPLSTAAIKARNGFEDDAL